MTSVLQTSTGALPDENGKRFVAVLNAKHEMGKLLNALGHMSAGLTALVPNIAELCFLTYADQEGNQHHQVSHFPFIVLKAGNSNQIRTLRQQAVAAGMLFTEFTESMSIGTSEEQLRATAQLKESELEYLGICLFGPTPDLKGLTRKFSLFR